MPDAPRSTLPFGAVMATGAASQLAGAAGVGPVRVPLLWVTVALASAVIVAGAASPRGRRREPAARLGDFTVPIGLAVIGSGLTQLGVTAAAAGAAAMVAAAWAATGVLVVTVVLPLVAAPPGLAAVDGAWFLAPAALLADAIGAAAVAGRLPGHVAAVGWVATAAAALGAIGYLAVVGLASARLVRHRLGGAARAPWWIAAGCGGLSAAALGRVSAIDPAGGPLAVHGFGLAALVLWAIGCLALLPVLAGSIRYLARLRRVAGRPPWPPTFSTGVFALGASQVGRLDRAAAVAHVGDVGAVATVCLWGCTVVAHVPGLSRRVGRRRRGGGPPVP